MVYSIFGDYGEMGFGLGAVLEEGLESFGVVAILFVIFAIYSLYFLVTMFLSWFLSSLNQVLSCGLFVLLNWLVTCMDDLGINPGRAILVLMVICGICLDAKLFI